MRSNRRRDTSIELALRSVLHARGFRYRVDYAPVNLRRRADVVFTAHRVAVFVDGCFWHGCPQHYVAPKSNWEFWSAKVAANRARDIATSEELRHAGWTAVRIWEHVALADAVRMVEEALGANSSVERMTGRKSTNAAGAASKSPQNPRPTHPSS